MMDFFFLLKVVSDLASTQESKTAAHKKKLELCLRVEVVSMTARRRKAEEV